MCYDSPQEDEGAPNSATGADHLTDGGDHNVGHEAVTPLRAVTGVGRPTRYCRNIVLKSCQKWILKKCRNI